MIIPSPQTALTNLFEGKEVHITEYKNDVWIPLNDLAVAWGIDRTTPFKIVSRNIEAFKDMITMIDGDIMSPSAGMHLNERGLYLMMGKISASRLKNKEASAAIIRFQRWYPELIQKYRKKELVHLTDYDKVLNDIRFVKELAGLVGAEALPLYCRVLEKHDMGDLGGLLVVQKDAIKPALPALPKPKKDYLTATDIGERIGKSPHEVNMFLYQHHPPLLIKDQKGEWRLTNHGKEYGEERIHELANNYFVWRIKWRKIILEKFNVAGEKNESL